MAPLWYRMRSWVRGQWRALCALAVIVAIVAGAVVALLAGAVRTMTAPDRYSSWRGKVYDVSIQQSHGSPRLSELDALPATASVEAATFVFGGLTAVRDQKSVDALVFAGVQGPLGTRLVAGRQPDPAHPTEFVATRALVASTRARIGDRFDLALLTQAQADQSGFDAGTPAGPALTATLVGVIDGPSDLNDGYNVALFPRTLLAQGDVGISASVMVAALAPGS